MPVTTPFVFNPGALTCGANPGSPVTGDYASPFKLTGTIRSMTVDVSAELIRDGEAELRVHTAADTPSGEPFRGTRRNGRSGRRRRFRQSLSHHQRIGDLAAALG